MYMFILKQEKSFSQVIVAWFKILSELLVPNYVLSKQRRN